MLPLALSQATNMALSGRGAERTEHKEACARFLELNIYITVIVTCQSS